jgi:23S rRNA pseudouridine1911/1915/1917 synthase
MIRKFEVNSDEKTRIDVYLSSVSGLTRSHVSKLCEDGRVSVNGKRADKCGEKVKCGDIIEIDEPELVEKIEKKDIPIDVIYSDGDIAVINKQRGLTVHPAAGNYNETLVNALMFHLDSLSGINGEIRPGIVHRLDKDTTGVMVVAKNDAAHVSLSSQIQKREVSKVYIALLEGNLPDDEGEVNAPIGRNPKDRKLMAVINGGREARSKYRVLARYKEHCLVAFRIYTGRTHQIRVHAKYLSHPVVGDKAYGFKKQKFAVSGQLLHSFMLRLTHPTSGEEMTFFAPLPEDFKSVLAIVCAQSGLDMPDMDIIKQVVGNIH